MNAKLAIPVLALAAVSLGQGATGNHRQPVSSTPSRLEEFQIDGGGVPRGYMLLGQTTQAPRGFSYTGLSVVAGNAWSTRPNMLTYHIGAAATTVEGKIFVIGGSDNSWPHNVVEAFDPATATWTRMSPLPSPRSDLAAVELNGRIYAIGGYRNTGSPTILDTVEEYDPMTDSWTMMAPIPSPRYWLAAAVVNGKIYAMGGASEVGYGPSASTYEYDPGTDSWQQVSPMPTPRWGLAAVAVNGRILAIGGAGTNEAGMAVEEFNPATNAWTQRRPLSSPRAYLAGAVFDDRVFVIGGNDPYQNLNSLEELDLQVDRWIAWNPMPCPRSHLAAASINGRIYALGGTGNNPYGPSLPPNAVTELEPGVRLSVHQKN